MSAPETVRGSMRTILRHLRKLPSDGKTNKVGRGRRKRRRRSGSDLMTVSVIVIVIGVESV